MPQVNSQLRSLLRLLLNRNGPDLYRAITCARDLRGYRNRLIEVTSIYEEIAS